MTLLGRIQQHPPLPDAALRDRERARQRFTDFRFDFYGDQDGADPSTKQRERGRSRRRSRSLSPNRVAVSDDVQDIPTAEKDQPSAEHTTTTNTTTTMSPPLSFQRTRTSPPKFRRTLSLTNIPLRHSTSSAPPPLMDPPLQFFTPQQRHQRSTSLSQTGRRSSHTPHAPVFDPEATHYQDPEARKKLRTYLASPQKFDEAVEFGFPSAGATAEVGGDGAVAATTTTTASRYQLPPIRTDARGFSRDMQTFLREDRVSFLEDNDDDDDDEDVEGEGEVDLETDAESITDVESPVTPSSAANMSMSTSTSTSTSTSFRNGGRGHARHISPSTFSSLDSSSGMRGVQPPRGGGGGLALNREMTLRMTLTRPDLRADEEQLYGWQTQAQQKDPFALEELHLSDDMTGGKSPFAVKGRGQGGLVARLRLLRRRG